MMRTILHDWSDERAAEILRNTRTAIGKVHVTSNIDEMLAGAHLSDAVSMH
jgi:hypothetical protein